MNHKHNIQATVGNRRTPLLLLFLGAFRFTHLSAAAVHLTLRMLRSIRLTNQKIELRLSHTKKF